LSILRLRKEVRCKEHIGRVTQVLIELATSYCTNDLPFGYYYCSWRGGGGE
jgi:hypothetical protein